MADLLTDEEATLMWDKICVVFPVLDKSKPLPWDKEAVCAAPDDLEYVEAVLKDLDITTGTVGMVEVTLERLARQAVVPSFWKHFEAKEESQDGLCDMFKTAVGELHHTIVSLTPMLQAMEHLKGKVEGKKGEVDTFLCNLRPMLHAQIPAEFHVGVIAFYERSFRVFSYRAESEGTDKDDADTCRGCEQVRCRCDEVISSFHDVNKQLTFLGLLDPLAGGALLELIQEQIKGHVQRSCQANFQAQLEVLEEWLQVAVVGWLKVIYGPDKVLESRSSFHSQLLLYFYETLAHTRIDQLFSIIVDYPESQAAVEDLRQCLPRSPPGLRPHLVTSLRNALQSRLLHPGVNTSDILTAYIAAIHTLRQLDPQGVLLQLVCLPVRRYLRSRRDTVRCILSSLLEESELAQELAKGGGGRGGVRTVDSVMMDESGTGGPAMEEDDEEETTSMEWATWLPDPMDADPRGGVKGGRSTHRSADIISLLVSIYGSTEVFAKEYQSLLAERLLAHHFDCMEREIRYLELLKLRFGEALLHDCEVMLKDMYDSKRINSRLESDPTLVTGTQEAADGSPPLNVSAMIVSAQFWPTLREEILELPPQISSQLQAYTKAFETLKASRTLSWKPHLGSVTLDVEVKGRTITFTVSPVHATIIWHFQEKDQWSVEELSQVMKVPSSLLRRRMGFWQSQGLLREVSTDVFVVSEEGPLRGGGSGKGGYGAGTSGAEGPILDLSAAEEDEEESALASAQDQREEELQVFWSYIVGMLTNLETLPLERIHQMLRMFALQGPTGGDWSLQELRLFLDRKVQEQKLLFSGGTYRLPKP